MSEFLRSVEPEELRESEVLESPEGLGNLEEVEALRDPEDLELLEHLEGVLKDHESAKRVCLLVEDHLPEHRDDVFAMGDEQDVNGCLYGALLFKGEEDPDAILIKYGIWADNSDEI